MREVTTDTSEQTFSVYRFARIRLRAKAQLLSFVWLSVCLGAIIGCSDADLARVKGKVLTHKGEPLVGATITARCNETGVAVKGNVDQDGRFELASADSVAGIPPGAYDVIVVEYRATVGAPQPPSISRKYLNASTSGLTLNVAPGEDKEVNWTLDGPRS